MQLIIPDIDPKNVTMHIDAPQIIETMINRIVNLEHGVRNASLIFGLGSTCPPDGRCKGKRKRSNFCALCWHDNLTKEVS